MKVVRGKGIIGTKGSGEAAHYVTVIGYYQKKDGSRYYIYSSWGEWLQVSESDLFQSSNNLKMYPSHKEYKLLNGAWKDELPK